MRRAQCGLVLSLALAASPACEIVRPLEPHPDVLALAVLLHAGEREARMLAVHPHRKSDQAPPRITATLEGPGWTADFRYTLKIEACTLPDRWPGTATCLAADLPERILPGEEYRIRGKAPLGPFTGEMTVPEVPLLLEPPARLRLLVPNLLLPVEIPMRFHVGPEVGTLLAELKDATATVEGSLPRLVEGAEADTITILPDGRPVRFSLYILGIGWNYTNFLDRVGLDLVPRPWPSFGIEGEGTYGYFDGATPSRLARIEVGRR